MGRADSGFSPSATATASTLSIHPVPKRTRSAGMLEMWPQSFCARECEESNPSKQPCRLARPDYVYSGVVSFSLHMNLSYCVRATEEKKTLFINGVAPTTHSPINHALGISKILTLRLALRLFGKSSNNGSAVYIVLAI